MADREMCSITVSIEKEKMEALKFYLEKIKTTPIAELKNSLVRLYEENVPEDVREYLEENI